MTDHTEGPNSGNAKRPRFGYKKGWKLVRPDARTMDIPLRLRQLAESHMVSVQIGERARALLAAIVDGRLPVDSFNEARTLIKQNNNILTKRKIHSLKLSDTFAGHAIFMACQACENLRDRTINITSKKERDSAILQIAAAITVLSETQFHLLGGSNDDES